MEEIQKVTTGIITCTQEELKPWVEKVSEIKKQTKVLRIYFNNHYGGKAVVNALEFKEMEKRTKSSKSEQEVLKHAEKYIAEQKHQLKLDHV